MKLIVTAIAIMILSGILFLYLINVSIAEQKTKCEEKGITTITECLNQL